MSNIAWRPVSDKVGDGQRWTGEVPDGAAQITQVAGEHYWSVYVRDLDGVNRGNADSANGLEAAQHDAETWLARHLRVRLVPNQLLAPFDAASFANGDIFGNHYEWADRTFVIGERWSWGEELPLSSGELITASGQRFWAIFGLIGTTVAGGDIGEIDDVLVPIAVNAPNMPAWAPLSLNGTVQWPDGRRMQGLKLPGLATQDIFPIRYRYDARIRDDWRIKSDGWGLIGGSDSW